MLNELLPTFFILFVFWLSKPIFPWVLAGGNSFKKSHRMDMAKALTP